MGGGDLNAKKSWHPNTLKNQERVWKAEQAALEEKKRIAELQHERAQERDHAELTALAKNRNSNTVPTDDRLQWMYDKPDKKGQTEEYLLGKAIDASFDRPSQSEQGAIPALIRRPGPSDTSGISADVQVDIARKLREDPLVLVKERERAARAALLNNPLQRRRLTELLRKEQEKNKEKKEKNKSKTKSKNLDHMIATKLSALGGENNINLIELLESDSSDDSSIKHKHKKKKAKKNLKDQKSHKKSKKVKLKKERHSSKHKRISDSDSSSVLVKHEKKSKVLETMERVSQNHSKLNKQDHKYAEDEQRPNKQVIEKSKSKRKHYSDSEDSEPETKVKKHGDGKEKSTQDKRRRSSHDKSRRQENKSYYTHNKSQTSSSDSEAYRKKDDIRSKEITKRKYDESSGRKKVQTENMTYSKLSRKVNSLSEAERAARLAEMVKAGAEHESERGKRVAAQRAAINSEEKKLTYGMQGRSEAHALPTSLESRLKSNRHYIQRDKRHMNEHFARR